jgi:fumarate reductase subunit C
VSLERWRKWLPYTSVAAVILVGLIALAFHLAHDDRTNAEPEDKAQPPEVIRSARSGARLAEAVGAGSSRQQWRKWLPFTPVAAVILVILIALAFYLAHGDPTNAKPQNQAQPTERFRSTVEAAHVSPTLGPTAMPDLVARARDQTRASDLYKIGVALVQYRTDKGEFPSTDGDIQSGCGYVGLEALCKIKGYLDPIPSDPNGDPITDGYWYVCDGKTFTLIAAVDSPADGTPAMCQQRFYDHTSKTDLYCLTSVS